MSTESQDQADRLVRQVVEALVDYAEQHNLWDRLADLEWINRKVVHIQGSHVTLEAGESYVRLSFDSGFYHHVETSDFIRQLVSAGFRQMEEMFAEKLRCQEKDRREQVKPFVVASTGGN